MAHSTLAATFRAKDTTGQKLKAQSAALRKLEKSTAAELQVRLCSLFMLILRSLCAHFSLILSSFYAPASLTFRSLCSVFADPQFSLTSPSLHCSHPGQAGRAFASDDTGSRRSKRDW